MVLYIWINEFKHIKQTGFNLSSKYNFNFKIENIDPETDIITGYLNCDKIDYPFLFNDDIDDIKAIIGENGSGKSTLFEILIQNIMTDRSKGFDGFIITDKYIFNRKGVKFGDSLEKLSCIKLLDISNTDLVNYKRSLHKTKITPKEDNDQFLGQIATTFMDNLSIIHYSSLLNIDRVENFDGVAGSSKIWETDYWHYYDITTENCIIDDYYRYKKGESQYFISGDSELVAHKSEESKRNIEFLSSKIFQEFPFKNYVRNVKIKINHFYERFWENIDDFIKPDVEIQGSIKQVINSITNKGFKSDEELESNLYISFIYGALTLEFLHKRNFGNRGESNALFETIKLFQSSTDKTRIHKTTLRNFLFSAKFSGNENNSKTLFNKINKAVDFVLKSSEIEDRFMDQFSIPISESSTLRLFNKTAYPFRSSKIL